MEPQSSTPHVLIFPLPVQGHVTPMLNLAELFCLQNLKVTFFNTTNNHRCLIRNSNTEARFSRYPAFKFETVSDGLPDDNPRTGESQLKNWLQELVQKLAVNAKPLLRKFMGGEHKVTCLIVDGWLGFANDVADEAGMPVISFRCPSASCISTYFSVPKLIEAGDIPFTGNEEMDQLVSNIPGMESFLRCRDLPSFCREQNKTSCCDLQQFFTVGLQTNKQSHSLILNTFEDLEGPVLSQIRSQFSRVYSIGPLHAQLKYRLDKQGESQYISSSSLWEVDRSCISWLDQKPDKSVVYVSLGSTTVLTRDQYMEIWAGLVQSKKYFLWVVRPEAVTGSDLDNPIPDNILEGTKERGCMVKWAPQDEVLAHCWPYFADQQVNSRFVSEVWRIGLDMKDTCDRNIIEKMINDLMDEKKDELQKSMDTLKHLAKCSITEGGSSYSNLDLLIQDIKEMS